jgi:hypothetical protein
MTHAYSDSERKLREDALVILDYHWGSAYQIVWLEGKYRAIRRDDQQVLNADSPEAMTRLLGEDYQARPVPLHCMVIFDDDEP